MYSENHLSRRREKALFEYLKLLENSKKKIDLLQFFFHLLKINSLPSELKTKFEKSRNFSKEDISEIKSVLEKKLLRTEKSKQENLIEDFNDYVEDFFDETIPPEYKMKYPKEFQKICEKIYSIFSEKELDEVKSKNQIKRSFKNKIKNFVKDFLLMQENQLFSSSTLEKSLNEELRAFANVIKKEIKELQEIENVFSLLGIPCGGSNPGGADTNFIATYFKKNEKIDGIKELAKEIGKHGEIKEQKSAKKQRTYRGNIIGLEFSNDVNRILPSELALLMNEETELLFYKKFAEKKLMSFSYGKKATGEKQEKGPAIICIDTSGSMNGEPEDIAKSLSLFILLECIKEKRSCYIISFSVSIECLDLTNIGDKGVLNKFLNFLGHSFHGGTDFELCLNHALEILENKSFKNADVLVISDFCVGDFSNDFLQKIAKQKSLDTRFFSLLVGRKFDGNQEVINQFTDNWCYEENKIMKCKN